MQEAALSKKRAEISSIWPTPEERANDRNQKRDAILQTAAKFFVERGFYRTKLSDIADALGVTKPVIYHHFKSKNELLIESNSRGIKFIIESLDAVAERYSTGRDRVEAFTRSFVNIVVVDVGASLALVDDGELPAAERAKIRSEKRVVETRLQGYLREGIADGTIRDCDVPVTARLILGAVNSVSLWYREDGRVSVSELADIISSILGGGIFLYPEKAAVNQEPSKVALMSSE